MAKIARRTCRCCSARIRITRTRSWLRRAVRELGLSVQDASVSASLTPARALGLDCGPMSGFDNARVDAAFFPDGTWKSNFLCNLGYGDPASVKPRNPRLSFEEACRIE